METKYFTQVSDLVRKIKALLIREGINGKYTTNFLGKLITLLIIYAAIKLIKYVMSRFIISTLEKKKAEYGLINENRATTLINILNKSISVILNFIGILTVLEVFNIPTGSIIATAGVGGLAIGIGAQSLVKDIITGFFILLEDQYSVGDHVEIEGNEGIVEDLGLRVTKIRDFNGALYIIPNSNIAIVSNMTRGEMRALVNISIAYEEDVDKAIAVLKNYSETIWKKNTIFKEGPTILGVTSLSEFSVDIGIVAKTDPLKQWEAERIIRLDSLDLLKKEGIEIPYPKGVLYRGDE